LQQELLLFAIFVTHVFICTLLLLAAQVLWVLKNIPASETDPVGPFHAQNGGQFDEGSLSIADDPAGLPGKVLRVFYEKGIT
jgi:hypothetical protein